MVIGIEPWYRLVPSNLIFYNRWLKLELFYGDWHGTMVPSGTIKFDFFEPSIKIIYDFF
jgi:hypothetical protein